MAFWILVTLLIFIFFYFRDDKTPAEFGNCITEKVLSLRNDWRIFSVDFLNDQLFATVSKMDQRGKMWYKVLLDNWMESKEYKDVSELKYDQDLWVVRFEWTSYDWSIDVIEDLKIVRSFKDYLDKLDYEHDNTWKNKTKNTPGQTISFWKRETLSNGTTVYHINKDAFSGYLPSWEYTKSNLYSTPTTATSQDWLNTAKIQENENWDLVVQLNWISSKPYDRLYWILFKWNNLIYFHADIDWYTSYIPIAKFLYVTRCSLE